MVGPCEASVGYATTSGAPVVLKCGKPGKLYQKFILPFGVILCEDCNKAMDTKQKGQH